MNSGNFFRQLLLFAVMVPVELAGRDHRAERITGRSSTEAPQKTDSGPIQSP